MTGKMKRADYHSRLGGVVTMEDLEQAIWDADDHEFDLPGVIELLKQDEHSVDPVLIARARQSDVTSVGFEFCVNKEADEMREAHALDRQSKIDAFIEKLDAEFQRISI